MSKIDRSAKGKSVSPRKPRGKFFESKLTVKAKSPDAGAGDPGSLSGYLAVYGVLDCDAEMFLPGCFKKSIAQKVAAGKVPLMSRHFRDGGDAEECVGTITKVHEDDHGLFIDEAPFSSDADAQKIRIRVNEGHIKGLSVGFIAIVYNTRPPKDDAEKAACAAVGRTEIVEFVECELLEGTTTVRPANEEAGIEGSKSVCPHCKKNSSVAPGTANVTPPVPTGTAPAATAKTPHGKEARARRLKLLGVI